MADESGQDENFQATYIKDDVLSFVSKMERPESGVVFYISGLEPVYFLSTHKEEENLKRRSREVEEDRIARNYIDACLKELARVTEPGDVVVIGQGTKAFKPENYGFQLKSQTGEQFLFERV